MSERLNFGPGTLVSEPCPGVTLCCISPEARDLLDYVMEEWDKYKQGLPETMTVGGETWNPRESVYGFAYWLIRWSGMVQPLSPNQAKVLERKR